MAKASPVRPAGPREQDLYDLVDRKFPDKPRFYERVAKLTQLSPDTEKSSFYRVIRGDRGRKVRWRLGIYAKVLEISPEAFLKAWAEDEEAVAGGSLPLRLSPREVRDALVALRDQVARLERQVEALERRRQPRSRRAETAS